MGMGLNICRSIIESHRGRLWVENNVESDGIIIGCTFNIGLPITAIEDSSSHAPAATSQRHVNESSQESRTDSGLPKESAARDSNAPTLQTATGDL
jgi:hypothetical protein